MRFLRQISYGLGSLLIASGTLLSGCSQSLDEYTDQQPALDVAAFFKGSLVAHGLVKNYRGLVTERFTVIMEGTWDQQGKGQLAEDFFYADGRKEHRTWHLWRQGDHYIGTAADIDGEAIGYQQGFALNWRYNMNLKLKDGKTVNVAFNDWMYQLDENRIINQAEIRKFGIKVGEVVLYIEKQNN